MTHYGELLDSINLDKLSTYSFFSEYFENPRMSFVREDGHNLVYCCRVKSGLARQKRYIFAITTKEGPKYEKTVNLFDLRWKILQTRGLDEEHLAPVHTYRPKEDKSNIIKVKQKTTERFTYSCEAFPICITLLMPKSQIQPYSDSGTIGLALETYNCIVYLN